MRTRPGDLPSHRAPLRATRRCTPSAASPTRHPRSRHRWPNDFPRRVLLGPLRAGQRDDAARPRNERVWPVRPHVSWLGHTRHVTRHVGPKPHSLAVDFAHLCPAVLATCLLSAVDGGRRRSPAPVCPADVPPQRGRWLRSWPQLTCLPEPWQAADYEHLTEPRQSTIRGDVHLALSTSQCRSCRARTPDATWLRCPGAWSDSPTFIRWPPHVSSRQDGSVPSDPDLEIDTPVRISVVPRMATEQVLADHARSDIRIEARSQRSIATPRARTAHRERQADTLLVVARRATRQGLAGSPSSAPVDCLGLNVSAPCVSTTLPA
jgi:hypothetical protein